MKKYIIIITIFFYVFSFSNNIKTSEEQKMGDLIDLIFNVYHDELENLKIRFENDKSLSLEEKKDLIELLKDKSGEKTIDFVMGKDFFKNKKVIIKDINTDSIDKIAITLEKGGGHYLFVKEDKWIKYKQSKELFLKDFNESNFNFVSAIFFKNELYIFYRKYLNSSEYINIINKYSYNNKFLLNESVVFFTYEEDETKGIKRKKDFCLNRFINNKQITDNSLEKYMINLEKDYYEENGECSHGS